MNNLVRLILIFMLILGISAGSLAAVPVFDDGIEVGRINSDLVKEASGLVASRANPGVLWVHNDSGDKPRVYAVNTAGKLLGVYNVTDAAARDWEDIAIGPGPDANQHYLYIGDIGDNNAKRPSVTIYRVPEPAVDPNQPFIETKTAPAPRIELTYPDGPKDAETLMVDPLNGDLYIISKRELFSRVFMAPREELEKGKAVMSHVATLKWRFAVAGDISPDGMLVIVRSPRNASVWQRPKGEPLWHAFNGKGTPVKLKKEKQGESICFDNRGNGYYTTSEKKNQPIYYFGRSNPLAR